MISSCAHVQRLAKRGHVGNTLCCSPSLPSLQYRESGAELDRTKSRELTEGEMRLAASEAQGQLYDKR